MKRYRHCVYKYAILAREESNAMTGKRTNRIDLRVQSDAKEALQAAATLRHKSVSEFILDSALGAADEVLADRRYFGLNAEQ